MSAPLSLNTDIRTISSLRTIGAAQPADVVKDNDIVIALWGPEGSGKTTFLSIVANINLNAIQADEYPPVRMVRVPCNAGDIVIVDLPGFAHDTIDLPALDRLSKWLKDRYTNQTPLTAVLYFERIIGEARRSPTFFTNLLMFQVRCRFQVPHTAFLVTTMWDKITTNDGLAAARRREQQIAYDYWNRACVRRTSEVHRFEGNQASGLGILYQALRQSSQIPFLQSPTLENACSIEAGEIVPDDFVILLMGQTGTGKSTFVSFAGCLGDEGAGVGHTLDSETRDVKAFRIRSSLLRTGDVILVDTPGFGDSHGKSSKKSMKEISTWVEKLQKSKVSVSAVFFFHKISDNRIDGHSKDVLKQVSKFCSSKKIKNLCMVTTMWDLDVHGVGGEREAELIKGHWNTIIQEKSAKVARFQRSMRSALRILRGVTQATRDADRNAIKRDVSALVPMLPTNNPSAVDLLDRVTHNYDDVVDRIAGEIIGDGNVERLGAVMTEYRTLQTEAQRARTRVGGPASERVLVALTDRIPLFLRELFSIQR